jgi:hypothetical protein
MKYFFTFFLLFIVKIGFSQFLNRANINIAENGVFFENPFTGGLNSCQFSEIDLDQDGIKDLFVFDRTGNRILPYLCSIENNSAKYSYAPNYISQFPELKSWVILADYNCDNKNDIFTYSQTFVKVFKNISNQDTLKFELVKEALNSDFGTIIKTIFISSEDFPSVTDIDNDGDLDILTFQQSGGHIEYHQNQSIELYNNCDSLVFNLETNCWGNFFEGNNTYDFDNCNNPQTIKEKPPIEKSSSSHAGSTILAIDIDADNDKDVVLGDVSYYNLNLLTNNGTVENANMTSVNQDFPIGFNTQVSGEINSFPTAFYIDVNKDLKRDLIIAPNTANNAENFNSIRLYLNTNEDNAPLFEFVQDNFLQDKTIDLGSGAYPCVIDYNNDGLKDLLVGNLGYFDQGEKISSLALFKNVGTSEQAIFELISRDYSNLSQINLNSTLNIPTQGLAPTVGDLDNDGDKDLIVGDITGKLHFFKNNAPIGSDAQFVLESINYFNIDIGYSAAPFLFDINNDQLLDLVIGKVNGTITIALNNGTSENAVFDVLTENIGNVSVSNDEGTYGFSKPFLYEKNDNIEMLVASESGYIYHYNNISNNLEGTFNLVTDKFQNIKEGIKSSLVFEDFTNDDKRDMFLGNESGGLIYFLNSDISNGSDISQSNISEFECFPNPTSGILNIKTSDKTQVKLFNIIGQQLMNKTINQSQQLNLSYLPKGTYLINLKKQNEIKTFKIILK